MSSKFMKGAVIATTFATLMAPGFALAGKTAKSAGTTKCTGANDCKGKGSCKGASNDCKGQNSCKGTGVTMEKSADACTKKGGTVADAK